MYDFMDRPAAKTKCPGLNLSVNPLSLFLPFMTTVIRSSALVLCNLYCNQYGPRLVFWG